MKAILLLAMLQVPDSVIRLEVRPQTPPIEVIVPEQAPPVVNVTVMDSAQAAVFVASIEAMRVAIEGQQAGGPFYEDGRWWLQTVAVGALVAIAWRLWHPPEHEHELEQHDHPHEHEYSPPPDRGGYVVWCWPPGHCKRGNG